MELTHLEIKDGGKKQDGRLIFIQLHILILAHFVSTTQHYGMLR